MNWLLKFWCWLTGRQNKQQEPAFELLHSCDRLLLSDFLKCSETGDYSCLVVKGRCTPYDMQKAWKNVAYDMTGMLRRFVDLQISLVISKMHSFRETRPDLTIEELAAMEFKDDAVLTAWERDYKLWSVELGYLLAMERREVNLGRAYAETVLHRAMDKMETDPFYRSFVGVNNLDQLTCSQFAAIATKLAEITTIDELTWWGDE